MIQTINELEMGKQENIPFRTTAPKLFEKGCTVAFGHKLYEQCSESPFGGTYTCFVLKAKITYKDGLIVERYISPHWLAARFRPIEQNEFIGHKGRLIDILKTCSTYNEILDKIGGKIFSVTNILHWECVGRDNTRYYKDQIFFE